MTLHRDEQGQAAIAVLLMTLGVFVLAGLSLDAGLWFFDHRTAQNQAEAAATAAILELPDDPSAAKDRAEDWLRYNGEDALADALTEAANCDGMQAGEARIVFGAGNSTARVCLRRTSAVIFSGLTAITEIRVSAAATAGLFLTPLPYALMAMNPDQCRALDISGQGIVSLLGDGASYTASSCDNNALNISGNGILGGSVHDVCGGTRTTGGGVLLGTVNDGVCEIPDPFAHLDPPAAGACTALPLFNDASQNGTAANAIDAGVYCSLDISGNGTEVQLTGGVYVFKEGVQSSGQDTRLYGTSELLIYMTCPSSPCNGANPASFKISGGAEGGLMLELTGLSGYYEHIAIWVDRTASPSSKCVSITGQGNVQIDGNIYALGCTVQMSGQGDAVFDINGSIIGDQIEFSGQAQYNVSWDAENAPKIITYGLIE